MEINRRAAANRGNEAARSRAKVKERSSRDRGVLLPLHAVLGGDKKFTVTTTAVAANNLSEYVGFEG